MKYLNLILMASIMTIFMLASVSALEIDNRITEHNVDYTELTITNSFLGIPTSEIGKLKLNTPLVYGVIPGKNRLVGEYTINLTTEEYREFVKNTKAIDLKINKEVNRTITYKKKIITYKTVDKYKTVCNDIINENGTYSNVCNSIKDGTEEQEVINWEEFSPKDIKKGSVTIGVFADVLPGDYMDWELEIFGVSIPWAVWTDSMNVGLVAYWDFEEGSGTNAIDKVDGNNNLSTWGGDPAYTTGKVGSYGIDLDGNDKMQTVLNADSFGQYTWCGWFKPGGTSGVLLTHGEDAGFGYRSFQVDGGGYRGNVGTGSAIVSTTPVMATWTGTFKFLCLVVNKTTNATMYENNTVVGTVSVSAFGNPNTDFLVGVAYGGTASYWTGVVDEIGYWNRTLTNTEISDLYNGGTGLTYTPNAPPLSISTSLISPVNYYNTTDTSIAFSANATAVSGNVTNMSLYLWGSTLRTNTTTGLTGLTNSTTLYLSGLSDYTYTWNVLSCATDANNYTCSWGTNRTLTVDTTAPIVNITYPINNSIINSFFSSTNITLNFTAIHLAGALSSCWYNNGSTNITLTCGTNTTQNFTEGYKTIYYYANDTLNNIGSTSSTFFINYLRPLVNYSLTGIELENTTIYFNITATNLTQANATLWYNNTAYNMNVGSYNGTTSAFYRTIQLPEVTADTIKSFNISYYVNDIAYTTGPDNQTVYNIPALNVTAGLCSGTPVYWFTLQDEENLSVISGDFEYNFYYGLSNSTMVRTYGKITGSTNFSICTNTTINPNWTIGSGEILYSSSGWVDRRYYIFDNTVVTSAENLTLYDLTTSLQTSFKLEVEDTSLNPYDNIYTRLLRWYPDLNEYKIVDIGKTDDTGSTVIHVRTEDVDYRIGAYYTNGTLIYLAQPIRMVCLASPCTYTLKISPGETDYTSFLNIDYTFTYDEDTGIWNFVYSDTSGRTSTMNLTVYRVTSTTIYPVCSDTITGAVGALSCNTSLYSTGELRAEVYRSASPPVVIVQKVVHLFSTAFKGSTFGLWLSFLIGIPIVFLFAMISPIGALLGGIIAILPALYFGSINLGIVGGLAILAGIVAHFLKRVS